MTLYNAHKYMQNIIVIIDTNNLFTKWNKNNPVEFKVSKGFEDILKKKSENNAYYIDFFVSEITVMELVEQQKEYFKNKYGPINNETSDKIEKMVYDFFKSNCIEIFEYNVVSIKNIVERAIKKEPPFCGKRGKSDAGFKDAIIWESILKADKLYKNRPAKFIIFSNDRDFKPEVLTNEFKKDFYRNRINIDFINGNDWKQLLDELNNLFFELISNANVYEKNLISFLQENYGKNIKITNSRKIIEKISNYDLVKFTSEIEYSNKKHTDVYFYYNFLTKKLTLSI